MSYPPEVLAGAAVVTVAVVVGVVFLLRALSKPKPAPIGLEERNYQKFKLVKKTMINHNTYLFRFNLQSPQHRVGLPVGKHMLLRFEDANGDLVSRAYTPVTSDDTLGYFELLIKLYEQGKMSQHLRAMNVGDSIDCRGPNGHLTYEGKGQFSIKRKNPTTNAPETIERQVKTISMIAGGSGITPMLQILRDVCKHYPADSTKISLIFGNVTEEDILLRDELDDYAAKFPNVKIHYTLDKPTDSWKGGRGFVTKEMIQNNLYAPSNDNIVLLCGPPGMLDAMSRNLTALNYSEDHVFKY